MLLKFVAFLRRGRCFSVPPTPILNVFIFPFFDLSHFGESSFLSCAVCMCMCDGVFISLPVLWKSLSHSLFKSLLVCIQQRENQKNSHEHTCVEYDFYMNVHRKIGYKIRFFGKI